MKYENSTKTARNQALIEYRASHPELALAEIAQVFNISKQRVWKILKKAAG